MGKQKEYLFGQLVRVEWCDAFSEGGWWTEDRIIGRIDKQPNVISCGFVVGEHKDYLSIAGTFYEDPSGQVFLGNIKCIPHGMIKRVRRFK